MDIPLKLKYRLQKQPFKCGVYKSRTGNSHGTNKVKLNQGFGIRRKVYITHMSS